MSARKLPQLLSRVVFVMTALAAVTATHVAAQPRDPFPRGSDDAVEVQARVSAERAKMDTAIGASVAARYKTSTGRYPPHRWKDPGNMCANPDTVQHWQLDSLAMVAPWEPSTAAQANTFAGCFQAEPKPDVPISVEPCMPLISIGPISIEICYDPPPAFLLESLGLGELNNCCATYRPILEACGVDKPNAGFLLRHWWPENVSQINNFESASFDPTFERGNDEFRREPRPEITRPAGKQGSCGRFGSRELWTSGATT
jgi:hypothetical protein